MIKLKNNQILDMLEEFAIEIENPYDLDTMKLIQPFCTFLRLGSIYEGLYHLDFKDNRTVHEIRAMCVDRDHTALKGLNVYLGFKHFGFNVRHAKVCSAKYRGFWIQNTKEDYTMLAVVEDMLMKSKDTYPDSGFKSVLSFMWFELFETEPCKDLTPLDPKVQSFLSDCVTFRGLE